MRNQLYRKHKAAFTLAEMAVVIVIIGVMAALAMPRYLNQRKIVCNQEAVGILKNLYDAQADYKRDQGVFTSDLTDLAIGFYGQSNCFGAYTVSAGANVTCGATYLSVASIPATDGSYTLHISDKGEIVCLPCGSYLCSIFGY